MLIILNLRAEYIKQNNKICTREQNRKVSSFCSNLTTTSKQQPCKNHRSNPINAKPLKRACPSPRYFQVSSAKSSKCSQILTPHAEDQVKELDFKLHTGCAREISAHESKLGFTGLQSLNPAAALRMAALKARGANEQRAQLRLPTLEVNDRGGLSYCFQWVHLTGVQLEQRSKRKKEKCQVWTKIIMTVNHSTFLSSISKETVILNRAMSIRNRMTAIQVAVDINASYRVTGV